MITTLYIMKVNSTIKLMHYHDGRCKQCGLDEKEEEMDESTTSFCDAVSHLMLSTWTKESFQSADPDIHQIVHW